MLDRDCTSRDGFLAAVAAWFESNPNRVGTVVVLARNAPRVLRKREASSFQEVREVQARFPRNDVAFWLGSEASDPMLTYYPEFDARR